MMAHFFPFTDVEDDKRTLINLGLVRSIQPYGREGKKGCTLIFADGDELNVSEQFEAIALMLADA
jgi:hypothetical protein